MKTRIPAVPCILPALALVLSACGAPGNEGRSRLADCAGVTAADGPGAGSAAAHGPAQRGDGEVSLRQEGGRYVARRTVDIANDFGAAAQAQVQFDTQNGHVTSCARAGGGYRILVQLEARGATETDARAALDTMSVNHGDTLAAGLLRLSTQVVFAPGPGGGPSVGAGGVTLAGSGGDMQRGAHIIAGLPASARYAFDHSTSNGDVVALDFSGTSALFDSSNGGLALAGAWDSATLDTSNGLIELSGDYAALDAGTSNGGIAAELAAARSGTVQLTASNGPIEVGLASSGAALDLQASTTNGLASISAAGTEAVGAQSENRKHRRSPDYASRAVQVSVSASTTNGSASIRQ